MNSERVRSLIVTACFPGWLGAFLYSPGAVQAATTNVVRGPYLQMGTPTSVMVRWRTDLPGVSRVRYGTDVAGINFLADGTTNTTNHIVGLTGLTPDTFYYYSIGTTNLTLAGGSNYLFRTAPPLGSTRPMRVWALGDFGFTNQLAIPVRDAYYNYATNRYTDLWLMLGDNAYHNGGDEVWQQGVFSTYASLLRQTPVWSTIGNQETMGSANPPPTIPYFEVFTFPVNGEAGGVPSGTEKYYSFDYGNVHFVCLDSMSSARTNTSPMLQWLEADLAANANDWLIAFWHHPPYSKGSNDSDVRNEEIEMRTNAVRLLEANGVDLVLCGHSHSYERSYMLDGHYGFSASFTTNFVKDGGDGRLDGAGAYQKDTPGPAAHVGAVYAVAGSGASLGGGSLNHPAMFRSLNRLGSMVLDIHANRLDARFLRETGAIDDYFTIIKGASVFRIMAVTATNGLVKLSWDSVADRTYRVQFAPDPGAASWTDISGILRAAGATATWIGPAPMNGVGFYRIGTAGD